MKRQEDDCRLLAASLDWTVTEVYDDNDMSATNRRNKRQGLPRMLADADSGHGDAVIAWHPDRLYRQPGELEDLMDVLDSPELDVELRTVRTEAIDRGVAAAMRFLRQGGHLAAGEDYLGSASRPEGLISTTRLWRGALPPSGLRAGRGFLSCPESGQGLDGLKDQRPRLGPVDGMSVQLSERLEVLHHLVRRCDLHGSRQRLVVHAFVVKGCERLDGPHGPLRRGRDDPQRHRRQIHR
ncbi:recombinase family protein [Streptomyces sp. MK37H]|nr:recombinase family protein [Streptomyces sp. MK37H]